MPRQDSSISGEVHLVQRLAAAPCPEGTSCPRVTVSDVSRPRLSEGRSSRHSRAKGASPESVPCTPLPPEGCPPAYEGDFQRCITFTALQSWVMLPLGSQDACWSCGEVMTALLLFCRGQSLPAWSLLLFYSPNKQHFPSSAAMHTPSPGPQPAGEAPTPGPTGAGGGQGETLSVCPTGRAGSAEFVSAQINLKSKITCCRSSTSALLLQPVP